MNSAREEERPEWVRGELLGQGGFGSVHVAHFEKPFKDFPPIVAVKSSRRKSAAAELESERDLLKLLSDCPYIVKFLGDEVTAENGGGEPALNVFLELASGGTLADAVEEEWLPETQVREFTKQILGGLRRIHGEGFVHRDIKLENVLLVAAAGGEKMVAKVADLGLARTVEACKGRVAGTELYWAPEIVYGGSQTQASDIWAFGCVVFAMLTGQLPWDHFIRSTQSTTSDVIAAISAGDSAPEIPAGLRTDEAADFVEKCFSRDPEERPTAEELWSHPFVCGEKRFNININYEAVAICFFMLSLFIYLVGLFRLLRL